MGFGIVAGVSRTSQTRPARAQRKFVVLARRYQRKWKQVPFHDRLNLIVAASSFSVGAMAVVLTVVAIQMGQRQEELARRQTAIAERQAQVWEKQLSRDAQLDVVASNSFKPMRFSVTNDGFGAKGVVQVWLFFPPANTLDYSLACVNNLTGEKLPFRYMTEKAFRERLERNVLVSVSRRIEADDALEIARCEITLGPNVRAGKALAGDETWESLFKVRWYLSAEDGQSVGGESDKANDVPLACYPAECDFPLPSVKAVDK